MTTDNMRFTFSDLIALRGNLNDDQVPFLRRELQRAIADRAAQIVLLVSGLETMSSRALRQLLFLRQKQLLSDRADFYIVGANERVKSVLHGAGDTGTEGGDFVLIPDETNLPVSPV